MATKSTSARLAHAEETGLPVVSNHAHNQWDERMPDAAIAPETALEHAHGLQGITTHGHWERDPDPPRDGLGVPRHPRGAELHRGADRAQRVHHDGPAPRDDEPQADGGVPALGGALPGRTS